MAIIINEFEIVVETPQPALTDVDNTQQQAAPSLSPRDIEILLSYQRQRHQRVEAY